MQSNSTLAHQKAVKESNIARPLIILVGGLSSRLFALLGWPVFLEDQKTILGTKILSRIGQAGNMLDIALQRFPGRPTYLVCPAKFKKLFEHATSNYPNVRVLLEEGEGAGTGGAIMLALEHLRSYDLVDIIYGDSYITYTEILSRVLYNNHQHLLASDSLASMVLLEQVEFDSGLGYVEMHDGKVTRLVEKPPYAHLARGMFVNPAIYTLRPKQLLDHCCDMDFPASFSFEELLLPLLIEQGKLTATVSYFLKWFDLGTPKAFADHRFRIIGNENRIGELSSMKFCFNCIVHSCVPWYCLWAERLKDFMVALIPLGFDHDHEYTALLIIPQAWSDNPRVLAQAVKELRQSIKENPDIGMYKCLEIEDGQIHFEPDPAGGRLAPKLTIWKPQSVSVSLDFSQELNLPQITVKGPYSH